MGHGDLGRVTVALVAGGSMKRETEKLSKGLYVYKNILISYENEQPDLRWFFIWKEERQYFAIRTQAQRQIDRYLFTIDELTAAPTNLQLVKTDLTAYLSADLLLDFQQRLRIQGLGRSIAQLAQLAQASSGPAVQKRLLLKLVLSRLYAK